MRGSESITLHIGLDDIDSPEGMCTTFLGALLARRLAEAGYEFVDYPYLVRLNPNIPFKTRGNGSVSLHVRVEREDLEVIEELVKSYVERLAERHGKTDATAVLVVGSAEPLREVYRRALVELVSPYSVRRLLKAVGARVIGGRKRGVVGAAASIGAYPLHSYTYELLLYRPLIARERCRGVEDYVEELDRLLRPYIFANVDYATGRVLATPHGPDPVIAGIRSVNPLLLSALAPRLCEAWGALMAIIYKSNQATGQHLTLLKSIADVRPYDSVVVKGRVASSPAVIKGGHVIFSLEDSTGRVECAVYRETGHLARVARRLKRGDLVQVGGGVRVHRGRVTLNVEYLRVLKPLPHVELRNPRCPRCGHRMKSAGRGKGFKCPSCGYRGRELKKVVHLVPPLLEPGTYLQSPSAYRHLSPPREALGLYSVSTLPIPDLFLHPPVHKPFKISKG